MIGQFTVRRLRGRAKDQLVLVLQSHLLEGVDTVIVAPLLSAPQPLSSGLAVAVDVDGKQYQAALSQLGAVPMQAMGTQLASAEHLEDEIRRGIDRLFTGF